MSEEGINEPGWGVLVVFEEVILNTEPFIRIFLL